MADQVPGTGQSREVIVKPRAGVGNAIVTMIN